MVSGSTQAPLSPTLEELDDLFTFDGSTRIIVSYNGDEVHGRVSPYAMALASPVWKKFVFPPFRKRKQNDGAGDGEAPTVVQGDDSLSATDATGDDDDSTPIPREETHGSSQVDKYEEIERSTADKFVSTQHGMEKATPQKLEDAVEPVEELDFSDDDGEALLILLRITHFQFTSIPPKLDIATLAEVAALCDQYDCVHLVEPWLSQWLASENSSWKERFFYREKWLFIAWVFGREKVFRKLAAMLVLKMMINERGESLALAGGDAPMPPGIIENILRIRRTTIERLLEVPNKCIDQFTRNLDTICYHKKRACDAIIYGSLIRGLEIAKLRPLPMIDNVGMSVEIVAHKLKALEIHVHPRAERTYPNPQDHSACFTTNIGVEVSNILNSIEDPVLESHLRHMEVQKAKVGRGI